LKFYSTLENYRTENNYVRVWLYNSRMSELLNLGIDPQSIHFEAKSIDARVTDYMSQISTATIDAWGEFWPKRLTESVKKSNLFLQIATTTAEVTSILGMEKLPKLGLLNGFFHGKLNYLGYCWEDEEEQVWVGLEESWISSIAESIDANDGIIPYYLENQIKFVMAEEVFHAFIREIRPDIAEVNIQANASNDPEQYWSNLGELAAKEFASMYLKGSC